MPLKAAAHIEAMSAFALANFGGYDRATLAQNESAFPPSLKAIEAGRDAVARSHLYPDPDWTLLRDAIAKTYGVERDLVLCGAGSMELIACTIAAFAGPGVDVLATSYAYNFAASAAARVGAAYVKAQERGFEVSVDAILAALTPATRIVFVCNPGNPTGTRIRNTEVLLLRAALPGDVLLMIDQAYGEFDDQDPQAVFALAGRGDTVVLRSLSKAYGLAGARVGWGLFAPQIAAEVRKMQNSNQVSTISLAMAVAAVEDQAIRAASWRVRLIVATASHKACAPPDTRCLRAGRISSWCALPTRRLRRRPTMPCAAPTSSCAAFPVTA